MALKWIDGFDTYGTTINSTAQPSGVLGRRYTAGGTAFYIRAARLGSGRSLCVNYTLTTPALTTDSTLIIGAGLCFQDSPAYTNGYFLHLYDGATRGLYFTHDNLVGEIRVYRDESTDVLLGTTSGAKIRLGGWNYIEFKVKCDNAAGTVDIRVNGVNVLSLSGIDTKATAQTHDYFDKVQFSYSSYPETWVDDLYICDGSGVKNNDFLGICKVETLFPSADVSGKNEWTPASGVDHYAMVDETQCDDDTTYLQDTVSGHLDQFEFGNAAGLTFAVLKGITLEADCRETDATNFTLIQRAERTSVSEGSALAIAGTSYETHTRVMEDDTEGADWTVSNFDATQFGVKVG